MREKTLFIVNPLSGAGHCGKLWHKHEQDILALTNHSEVVITQAPLHATELARNAIKSGVQTIIAVGGDGTVNEVVNGFYENELLLDTEAVLGVLPSGTGCDFVRNLNLPANIVDACRFLLHSTVNLCDVGLVRFDSGKQKTRHFINVADVGLGGVVAAEINISNKRLGAKLSFLLATLRAFYQYKPSPMQMFVDGSPIQMGDKQLIIAVANGRFFGAGMCVGEQAKLDDGQFDVVAADDMGLLELIPALMALHSGKTPKTARIRHVQGKDIRIVCEQDVGVDLDGELVGFGSVTISVLSKQIRLLGLAAKK